MELITCAFTGHRPHKLPWKYNEADPRCAALKETLAEQITTLAGAGVMEYFTGGADGCLIDRNHRLVESAGLLLAVFNGVRRSGTGATVNYARKLGREIIVINPLTRSVTREGGGT